MGQKSRGFRTLGSGLSRLLLSLQGRLAEAIEVDPTIATTSLHGSPFRREHAAVSTPSPPPSARWRRNARMYLIRVCRFRVIEIKTAPADFRFPTTNQTRHCFTRYVEYHRCLNAKGDDAGVCEKFAKYYRSLCPGEWVSISFSFW
ncbi:Cytochrome c oxidase subunit 6b-1 [Zea mays]|uniref:Cytochrome c oxidase subunit 6b-1 n=1 Tax=Zea mays TaxID=4577 RepID=A0A3L6F3V6_MAIZE|nr:Cytochrome c oxidase subunit 6b-1 [Zea mays]